jgi:hypothetical protein
MTDYLVNEGKRIHTIGASTSEVDSTSLSMWSDARKIEQAILECTKDQLTYSHRMPTLEDMREPTYHVGKGIYTKYTEKCYSN